jgi:hypothetical protein
MTAKYWEITIIKEKLTSLENPGIRGQQGLGGAFAVRVFLLC